MSFLQFTALAVLVSSFGGVADAQQVEGPTVAVQLKEMLGRSGHSPSTEEIQSIEMARGTTDAGVAREAVAFLLKALADPDLAIRKYALASLVGMQVLPDAAVTEGSSQETSTAKNVDKAGSVSGPASYKSDLAKVLLPLVPSIGACLVDDDVDNRTLAATVLGGFSGDAAPSVSSPLFNFLKRDDAVGPVGVAVVSSLLQIGPVSAGTAVAITRFLRRPDQTTFDKTELVEAIASKPNQSRMINEALVAYMDSDDASLQARVVLSLPQMDLSPEMFAELRSRLATLASGSQDNLPVNNAAKAVSTCWTKVKMESGCPAY